MSRTQLIILVVAVVAVGWCVTWWIYKKSASPATTAY